MSLIIQQAQFKLLQNRFLNLPHFAIQPHQYWVIVGGNGSGKTAFSACLAGNIPVYSGDYRNSFQRIALFSFEKQRKILEETLKNLNNDDVNPDDFGQTAEQVILNGSSQQALCAEYADKLGIRYLLDRPFIKLSTGESRKVLFAQALVSQPDLLILDDPFEGLDRNSLQNWVNLLAELQVKMAIVLIVNRFDDIPDQTTHIAILDQLELVLQGEKETIYQQSIFQQLAYAETATDLALPAPANPSAKKQSENSPHLFASPHLSGKPNFELQNVVVKYGEQRILDHLSWVIYPKQHWWIKGPNGAGKSTLLSLLTGDHPQAFSNHVILFGKQRGSGETIWEIKQHIGYVSSQLHLDYRVNCSVLEVIVSGFFDSIGVYQKIPDAIRIRAMEWLARLKLENLAKKPFRSLSWGQQRLLLITRAMVKHPPVLILDEPLLGLDGINRKLVKHFIDQLVKNSSTQLLFVSHQDQDAPSCITHLFEFVPNGNTYSYMQRAV